MKLLVVAGVFFSFLSAYACEYSWKKSDIKVEWVAYKTPSKVGVKGSFTKFEFTPARSKASHLGKLLQRAKLVIDPKSVATGDVARDQKIVNIFFGSLKRSMIQGQIVGVDEEGKTIRLLIKMNGKTQIVPLHFALNNDFLMAEGTVDVLNFSMAKPLTKLTQNCETLHQGKTWSTVDLLLSVKLTSQGCSSVTK